MQSMQYFSFISIDTWQRGHGFFNKLFSSMFICFCRIQLFLFFRFADYVCSQIAMTVFPLFFRFWSRKAIRPEFGNSITSFTLVGCLITETFFVGATSCSHKYAISAVSDCLAVQQHPQNQSHANLIKKYQE